jgi:hypothetical protein
MAATMLATSTARDARAASWLLLLGAVLGIVGNAAHPIVADDELSVLFAAAQTPLWMPIHLTIVVGTALIVAGLVVFVRVVAGTPGEVYARVGAVFTVIGGVLLVIAVGALDGFGVKTLATSWEAASAAEREVLEATGELLLALDFGVLATGVLLVFGLGLGTYAAAILRTDVLAAWIGYSGVVLGVLGVATGLLLAMAGPTPATINYAFRPLGALVTLFAVAVAFALRRVSPEVSPRAA